MHNTFVQGKNYFTAAISASEVKESAKNASSGNAHCATNSRLADSTTIGAPHA
jgi:hypothetical protein